MSLGKVPLGQGGPQELSFLNISPVLQTKQEVGPSAKQSPQEEWQGLHLLVNLSFQYPAPQSSTQALLISKNRPLLQERQSLVVPPSQLRQREWQFGQDLTGASTG